MNSSWLGKVTAQGDKSTSGRGWLEKNWHTIACLLGIFILAMFVRFFFAYNLATEFGTPYLLGGGADSHYNARIINYIAENHEHLFEDPLRTYPLTQGENVRPPLYQWSVVLGGYVLAPFVGNLEKGIQLSFILSSAFWGAMTTIPVYLIGKHTFGKKAGIAGAFLLAISAGHLERGVITNTNHDAFTLFLVVTAFYFFMQSLHYMQKDRKWVSDWMDRNEVKKGFYQYFSNNKRSILYAAMTGMAIGSVALSWKGYSYAVVIILVYFLIQLVIDKFRDRDSMGITINIFVTMMIVFFIALPWYGMHRPRILTLSAWLSWPLENWFQIPLIIFLGTFGVGVYFTVTRDLPWILTFSILGVIGGVFFGLGPDVIQSAAGQYFIENKLYATIAEAQPPDFSRLVMASGIVTFFLSWIGLALAVWHVIKKWTRSFVFILIWAAFSIYMTTSAARFIFIAAPAYALTAGWVIALIFDKTEFEYIGRRFRSHRGSTLRGIKEGVKVKHILISLAVVFLLLVPNTIYVFDAGIPFEEKQKYEEQIHDSLPEALRAPDHDPAEGQQYLGAFGYSLDKPTDYWQASWEWFSEQDEELPPEERPAFLSWWDYGFEAMAQGKHPTVADNFQHAYRFAGNVLMAQNESEIMALYVGRMVQLPYNEEGELDGKVREILIDHLGEEKTEKLESIYDDPGSYRQEVLSNPEKYHPRADDIDNGNLRWGMIMGTLSSEDLTTLSSLYRDIRLNSGYKRLENGIGYLAVDSRLFPTSAKDTGIFHAPAFLSDHRVEGEQGMRTPVDFYIMELIDAEGRRYESRDEVPPDAEIVDQEIKFQPMFYNSTIYKVFAGYAGQHIGEQESIPGIDNRQLQPMPGWDLTHFKMDHRTAYFNPYPRDEVQNHTDAWKAISLEEAKEYEDDDNVTVDTSGQSYMRQGVVFLQYYDGAIMEGEVTTAEGSPVPNAKITVLDENGVAHHNTRTDQNGSYRAFLPAGEITVTVTNGGDEESESQQKMLRQEGITLDRTQVEISQEQAMRKKIDSSGDGRWDYLLEEDFEVNSGKVSGRVFLDREGNGEFDEANDTLVEDMGKVVMENDQNDVNYTVGIENGTYEEANMVPGKYSAKATMAGSGSINFSVEPDGEEEHDIPISIGELGGNVTYGEGANRPDEDEDVIELTLRGSGQTQEITLGESRFYFFEDLIPGNYTVEIETEGYALSQGPIDVEIEKGGMNSEDIHIVEARRVEGVITRAGEPVPNQRLTILGRGYDRVITTDDKGEFDIKVPEEVYQIHGVQRKEENTYVHLGTMKVESDMTGEDRYRGEFERGHKLEGRVEHEEESIQDVELFITKDEKDYYYLTSNAEGLFSAYLPKGDYTVYGWKETGRSEQGEEIIEPGENLYFLEKVTVSRDRDITLEGERGYPITGKVNRGFFNNGEVEQGDGVYSQIEVSIGEEAFVTSTDLAGNYKVVLPEGESVLRIDKKGYYKKVVRVSPSEESEKQITLEAKNVSVGGELDFDREKTEELTVRFNPLSDSAVGKNITVDENSYQVGLQPGKYEIVVDEDLYEGDAKYQLSEDITIDPGDDTITKNLDAIYRMRVTGAIMDEEGTPISAGIHFSGVEDREIGRANGSYDIYLQDGNYSVRAVNQEKEDELSVQKHLSVEQATVSNLTLKESIKVRSYLTYRGDRKADIPVLLKNNRSGYEIETVSESHGELNISLSEGEYKVEVDFETMEEIEGMERDVIYSLDEVIHTDDLATPGGLEMERKILNSTFTGTVGLDGQPVKDVEVQLLSNGEVEKSLTTDEEGSFEVSELLHGQYTLYIMHEKSRSLYARFEPFTMTDEDKHLDLLLKEAVILRGRVYLNGENSETDEMSIQRGDALKRFETDEDGDYRVVVPKGRYELTSESEKETDDYGLTTYRYIEEIDLKYDRYHNIELEKVKEYVIEVDDLDAKKGSQGETLTYRAQIKNAGNTRDEYEISVSGETKWDIEFEARELSLMAGETKNVEIEVTLPDNASVDHSPIKFTVDSMNSAESVEKEVPVEVRPVHGVELSSELVNKGYSYGELTCEIEITNTGNIEERYNLRVSNKDELRDYGWKVSMIGRTDNMTDQESKPVEITLEAIRSNPKENVRIELKAESETKRSVEDSVTVKTSVPHLTANTDSIELEGEKVSLEEESFTLSTWQWSLIIFAAALVTVYVMKKKRWI